MTRTETVDFSGLNVEHLAVGETILHEQEIRGRLKEMAADIAEEYRGKNLLLIGLLNGAVTTTVELQKFLFEAGLDDVELGYIQTDAAYNNDLTASGKVTVNDSILKVPVEGRDILVVDDIADTLHTFSTVQKHLAKKGPMSVRTFALLDKPERHEIDFPVDYVGFRIPNVWVEGFGMDSFGLGRGNGNIVKGPTHAPPRG